MSGAWWWALAVSTLVLCWFCLWLLRAWEAWSLKAFKRTLGAAPDTVSAPVPALSFLVPAATPPPLHEDPTTDLVSAQLGVTHAEFMCFLQKTIDGVESGALTVKICDAYWSERTTQRDGVLHVEIGTVSPMKFRVGVNASVEYRETWVDVRCSSFDACIQFYNKTAVADKERALYAALCTLLVQKCIALRDPATWGVMYETHHQLRDTPMFQASGCCSKEKK